MLIEYNISKSKIEFNARDSLSNTVQHGLHLFVFFATILQALQQVTIVHVDPNTVADATQIRHVSGDLLDRVHLLLQEICLQEIAEILIIVSAGDGVNLQQTLCAHRNEIEDRTDNGTGQQECF